MAANTAVQAHTTVFKKGATTLADVTGIAGPTAGRDDIDVTHLDSPDRAKEFMPGLADWGEVTLSISYDPANADQLDLVNELDDTTVGSYSVVFPGPKTWAFSGYCKGFEPGAQVGEKLTATATIKITGKATLT